MKHRLYTVIIACAALSASFISCNNKQPQQHEFYYYPKTNVYYDLQSSTYIYSLDGGRTWYSVNKLTENEPGTLGNKQIIYSTSNEIYKDNAAHRKKYGGSLIVFANTENDVNAVDTGASERPAIKKNVKHKSTGKKGTEYNKPQKKPLKDFFKKIFGKHKGK
jgi:hypothetical protein